MKRVIPMSGLAMVTVMLTLAIAAVLLVSDINLAESVAHLPVFVATVPTPSMSPTIDWEDMILVTTLIEFDDIMLDDIVVFNAPNGMTVHRVIDFEDGSLITKGDNNSDPDEMPVTELMYVGSVVYVFDGVYWAPMILIGFLGGIAYSMRRTTVRKRNM